MRVLLGSSAAYAPPRGGSTRSNLAWLRQLAAKGHACHVICGGDVTGGVTELEPHITVLPVADPVQRAQALADAAQTQPDAWVLVSSEDLSHTLLRAASRTACERLVYLAHTPQFFPFGPESWNPDAPAAAMVREAAGIVAISHYVAQYTEQHLGARPAVIHPPIYAREAAPRLHNFARGPVLMINPCQVKGIAIFLALARHFPEQQFAALRGWGTTTQDAQSIQALPNARLLEPVSSMDELLAQTRLLLMPSIWTEGFGLIVMEAMLRGVPVVASNSGGLAEAKQGTGYVVPVSPVLRYEPPFDENHLPRAVAAEQDITPWVSALERLLTDEAEYTAESIRSQTAARAFTAALEADALERYLAALPRVVRTTPRKLSPAREALLEKLMRRPQS